MKTTIDLSDSLVREAKNIARSRGTTFRALVESALRSYIQERHKEKRRYTFKPHTFRGEGVQEGISEGDWNDLRNRIYEGRGG